MGCVVSIPKDRTWEGIELPWNLTMSHIRGATHVQLKVRSRLLRADRARSGRCGVLEALDGVQGALAGVTARKHCLQTLLWFW